MKAQQRAVASDSEDEVDKIDSHFESDSQDDGEGEEAKIVSRHSRSKGSKTRGKAHSSHAAESKNSSRKHGKRVNSKKATILDNWDDDDNDEDDDEDENVSPHGRAGVEVEANQPAPVTPTRVQLKPSKRTSRPKGGRIRTTGLTMQATGTIRMTKTRKKRIKEHESPQQ